MNIIKIRTDDGPRMTVKAKNMPSVEEIHRWHQSMSKCGHVTLTVNGEEHVFRTENVNGFEVHILTPGKAPRPPGHPELPFEEETEPELI